ncbi:putative ABC transport system permease protein [Jatrophihabitans endophyticus]|uniref:Putative ABC transport system permease protein n=1 Tax=Jatrophihabitans endophyticus TaxID=1206085 RepID=A0A1M5GFC9_9ACTN|nr:FtsX-like permease family protein [Jatrophihabitans endophyticus]SHG02433.1 putative ABC transport system permease protein [Jatrophihabitans endophyticus]
MRTVAVRNLRSHKVRLLLTLVSVLLGTAFVSGSFVFTDTLKRSFDAIFATSDEGIDARVQPREDFTAGVPTDLVRRIARVPGVAAVQPQIGAQVAVVDAHGTRISTGGAPSQGGAWQDRRTVQDPPELVRGAAPTATGQVAVNESAATRYHLAVGDRITVVAPNAAVTTARVVGLYRVAFDTGGYLGALFPPRQALTLFTDGRHYTTIDVSARAGVTQATLAARIERVLPADLEARTGRQVRDDDTQDVADALSFITVILLGFGIVALLVGTFIIYNTFSMIVAQRQRELALLRAVGASRRQVQRSVVFESLVTGLVGSALGLAGGIGLAYGLRALLDALDVGLPAGELVLLVRTVVVSILLGTAVTVVAAWSPARRASRIAPVAAMREEFATPTAAGLRRRTALGATVAALAVLGTILGLVAGDAGSAASFTGLGLLAAVIATMLLSPVLARWVIHPLGRVVGRPFGVLGRLARTNAVRNPRRTAATGFALTLGMLLVTGIAVVGASAKASIGELFSNGDVRADYILTSDAGPLPVRAAAAAGQVAGVGSTTELHPMVVTVAGDQVTGTAVDGPLERVLPVTMTVGRESYGGTDMIVSETYAADHGWRPGTTHRFTGAGGTGPAVTVRVTGVYRDADLVGPWVVSGTTYRTLTPHNRWGDDVALVTVAAGADAGAVRAGLERAVNDFYVVDVRDRDEFRGYVAGQVDGLLGLLYGLLALAIVIAILGIVNTQALSVVERRRELGMLRAVGMQRAQVRRTVYLESLLIAVFGAFLGVVLGVAYGSLFTRTLHDEGLRVISVPWVQAVVFLVLAAVVGVLAALWPGWRAARTPPLDAVSGAAA